MLTNDADVKRRAFMNKLHVTQDDFDYWMLSLENEDGSLILLAHQFPTPDHLIENANEMVARGLPAVLIVDPPRQPVAGLTADATADYETPAPRKAGG